jgi:AcrR family transcriptional regulator
MAAIAARVGGSKGTLYNYFPSKESLFAALVRRECETMLLDPLIQQGVADDPVEGLRQIGLSFTTATLGEHALSLQRLVVAEACRFPELGRAFYENGPKRYVSLVADWISQQAGRGRLRVADPDLAASQFLDLCRSNLMHKALWNVDPPPSAAARRRSVEAAVDVFMAAYGGAGAR